MKQIPVGVIGATGYAGAELVRLLLSHPNVTLAALSSVSFEGKALCDIYPSFTGLLSGTLCNDEAVLARSEVVFASLPHGLSEKYAQACVQAVSYTHLQLPHAIPGRCAQHPCPPSHSP